MRSTDEVVRRAPDTPTIAIDAIGIKQLSELQKLDVEYEAFRQLATNLFHKLNTAARLGRAEGMAIRVHECYRTLVSDREGGSSRREAFVLVYSSMGQVVQLRPICIRDAIGMGRVDVIQEPGVPPKWRLYAALEHTAPRDWHLYDVTGQSSIRLLQPRDLLEILLTCAE